MVTNNATARAVLDQRAQLDTRDPRAVLQACWGGDESQIEPIYPDDAPAYLCQGDLIRCPRTNRSTLLREDRYYTYFELMTLIHGDDDAPGA